MWRFSIARLLVVTALVGVAIAGWTKAERLRVERDRLAASIKPQRRGPNDYYLRTQPMTLTMTNQYGMDISAIEWYASVDVAGKGTLEVDNFGSLQTTRFAVSDSQLAEFREALISEGFFDLPDEVGGLVPDSGAESLTIVVGDYAKTLRINYLANLANSPGRHTATELKQAAQALRLWIAARSWIQPPGAFDDLAYALRILPSLDPSAPNPAPAQLNAAASE
jgi:hypothetical protein